MTETKRDRETVVQEHGISNKTTGKFAGKEKLRVVKGEFVTSEDLPPQEPEPTTEEEQRVEAWQKATSPEDFTEERMRKLVENSQSTPPASEEKSEKK